MSVTQGMRFLAKAKVPHELKEYDYRIKGAEAAAEAIGWPLEKTVKTLVVALEGGGSVLCLMPGESELSLKKLARQAGVKSARMTTTEEAERLTGYLVGGISPFGTRRALKVWMHSAILDADRIAINCGRRGLMAILSPVDVRDVLSASVADLAA